MHFIHPSTGFYFQLPCASSSFWRICIHFTDCCVVLQKASLGNCLATWICIQAGRTERCTNSVWDNHEKKKHVSSGRFFVKANTDLILKNTHKLMQTDQCNMQFDLSNTNRYCCRCLAFADLNRLHFKAEAHRHHIEWWRKRILSANGMHEENITKT